ncbi:MAG: NAD(P)H-dependent oxidoreductase [Verrucomicrobia bacterium]|nr:NAD(P)H-dependent oxidoreductase [Verrucomicrobiota bacterium]
MSNLPTAEQILTSLRWRYATKAFDPNRKVSAADWQTLSEVLQLAPSSFGLQLWKFFVIEDPKIRETLVQHAWGQRQVVDASHLIVFAGRTDWTEEDIDRYLQRAVEVRGGTLEALAPYRGMMVNSLVNKTMPVSEYISRQVYIALGQFMTAAALLQIDTCPMEGFEPAKFDEVLGLPAKGYTAKVLLPVGYRAEGDKYAHAPKVRFPLEQVIERI